MDFQAIPTNAPTARNRADEITLRLRREIVSGRIAPGTPLAEPTLAKRFNASRAPVREALIALEKDGLVEFNDRSRTRVRSLVQADFEEIISMRAALESLAARLVAPGWGDANTRVIEGFLRKQQCARTVAELSHLDVEMHETIVRLSSHRRLIAAWLGIRWQFEMGLASVHREQQKVSAGPREITVDSHRKLLAALATRDPATASVAMTEHIESLTKQMFATAASTPKRRHAARVSQIVASVALACGIVTDVHGAIDPREEAFFEAKIRPLLVDRCYECHGAEKAKGGLTLDTRAGWQKGGDTGPAIVPGRPDDSLLIKAVRYADADLAMPPRKKGGKLTEAEIAALTEWVKMGAPDPRDAAAKIGGMKAAEAKTWWAFQPLPRLDGELRKATVDGFIDAKLTERSLIADGPADKRTLIRRATYDLTGLPPTPEEVAAFVADDSPGAFSKAVERLLASPQYGVQWGRHWLDVVRYADTAGENTDRPLPHAWRYRNWVFDAFNRDLPYDQFVRLQLAGDILGASDDASAMADGIVATGYLAIARRFGHDIDKDIHLTFEDVIDNVGKNFLGLTAGCARCHDHKYDPITSRDYYALYGIFGSTRFAFPGCEPKGQPRDLVPLMSKAGVDEMMKPWRDRVAAVELEKKRRASLAPTKARFKELASKTTHLLAAAPVGEGESVAFGDANRVALDRVRVRAGEVLQLTVLPNGNHGADSTLVEWTIAETGGAARKWSVGDLLSEFTSANPRDEAAGAAWCFTDHADGPVFLRDKRDAIDGNSALKAWSLGDTPSVFVNTAAQDVKVWTTLPARSFFVHPGQNRPVTVAWVSPMDGDVAISGRVADAHPAGLDGVAFQLEHIASSEFGRALVDAGRMDAAPLPDPGPEPVIPVAYAVVEGEAKDARIHERGDHEKLGEEVPRGWISVFGGERVPPDGGSGRRQLGNWIVGNPLAARVMVNRIWQGHFGAGLVRSTNDFGARGERPTHPELLDWLAAEFVASGYRVKSMHRLIMNSAAYQRGSARSGRTVNEDPENRLLARFNRRRLSAEEIRDSLLLVAGKLDATPGGAHPFPAEKTWGYTQHSPFSAVYETNKRSAYLMVQRQRRHPYLALFDGADPNASTPVRQTTTVPTQALYFLNDPFFHAQASDFAGRLMALPDDGARMVRAWELLFQRVPTKDERARVSGFLAGYPGDASEKWAACARVILAGNEFLHLD